LRVSAFGYQRGEVELEVDVAELSPERPLEVLLDGPPGSHLIRGRVVRAGQPAPGFQVGIRGLRTGPDGRAQVASGTRCYTAEDGTFAARWLPRDADELLALYPHWTVFDEFGALGPLPLAEALGRELVLEIEPGLRVPALVRGVQRGGRYALFVSLAGPAGLVPVTINGAPIEAWRDGEVQVQIAVPARCPSRLTVGYRTENAVFSEIAPPVAFDPAAPALPLVFELPPVYASIRGVVTDFAPAELGALRVVVSLGDLGSHLTSPAADGSFELERVERGPCELLLVLLEAEGRTRTLASLALELDGDVAGLVLRPN
jgi:hypothetical protein